jgi:protein ImuA
MPSQSSDLPRTVNETVSDLRRRIGLFSFQHDVLTPESALPNDQCPNLDIRRGSIIEWLAVTPGAGAVACAMQLMVRSRLAQGAVAIVDATGEYYPPALAGWGLHPDQTILVYPDTQREACWAIEQCLRCPGVSATWAWVEQRFSTQVRRRWQLAAEVGGGVGIFFRPEAARREPAWADLRLLVTPGTGGQGENRRVRIEVLYHRGGLGGTAQAWEIDHAEGVVRVVPELADSTAAQRAARA